jgi:hypothetical protein
LAQGWLAAALGTSYPEIYPSAMSAPQMSVRLEQERRFSSAADEPNLKGA